MEYPSAGISRRARTRLGMTGIRLTYLFVGNNSGKRKRWTKQDDAGRCVRGGGDRDAVTEE